MSISESKACDECIDDVDEFKCQSCGQIPLFLNSTGSGHEVCDDCLPMFKAEEHVVCPLPACKISSHMANKIKLIKEDLKKSKRNHEKAMTEVLGEISTINENFGKLSVKVNGIETNVTDVKTEVEDIREMKTETSRKQRADRETMDDLKSKVEALTSKTKDQSKEHKSLKMENEKMKEENSELKEKLKTMENEFKDFRSGVNLDTKELKERMFLMGNTAPQPDLLPMNMFNLMAHHDQFQPALTWNLNRLKKKLKQKTFEEWSDSFQWTGYPVKATAKLELNSEDNCTYMSMCLEGTSAAAEKEVPILPNVYYLLRNQNKREVGQHKVEDVSYGHSATFAINKIFDSLFVHKSWLTHQSFNANDSVTVEVHVEPPSMAHRAYSRNGLLSWVVKDCEKRRFFEEENLMSYQESPYFYTGPNGYKVQALLMLNGAEESKAKGPSAYINFLQGENEVPKSFPHRTTVTLISPKDPQRFVTKTVDRDIEQEAQYLVDICEKSELGQLIVDDTLYVRVNVTKITS